MDYTFVKGQFTEAQLEEAIIALFEQQEYTYVTVKVSTENMRIFCFWMTSVHLCRPAMPTTD